MLVTQSQASKSLQRNLRITDSGSIHIHGSDQQGTRLDIVRELPDNKGFVIGTVQSIVTGNTAYNATMTLVFHGVSNTYKVKLTDNLLTGTPPMVKVNDILTIPVTQLVGI